MKPARVKTKIFVSSEVYFSLSSINVTSLASKSFETDDNQEKTGLLYHIPKNNRGRSRVTMDNMARNKNIFTLVGKKNIL